MKEGGISFDQALVSPRIFLSHIEVKLNGSLAGSITKISDLGKEIAATMRGYGHDTPDWELTGLSYGNKRPGDVATFKFERREGSPPPEDIYFATSRMRTKDHLRILEILEKLL